MVCFSIYRIIRLPIFSFPVSTKSQRFQDHVGVPLWQNMSFIFSKPDIIFDYNIGMKSSPVEFVPDGLIRGSYASDPRISSRIFFSTCLAFVGWEGVSWAVVYTDTAVRKTSMDITTMSWEKLETDWGARVEGNLVNI